MCSHTVVKEARWEDKSETGKPQEQWALQCGIHHPDTKFQVTTQIAGQSTDEITKYQQAEHFSNRI